MNWFRLIKRVISENIKSQIINLLLLKSSINRIKQRLISGGNEIRYKR